MGEVDCRLHPVLPSGFTICRLNPPANQPQVMPAALSRSPIFCPPICAVPLPEQTSPYGSGSPITVYPPFPSPTKLPVPPVWFTTPLVWPEIRLIAPTVEGPKLVL